MVQLHPSYGVVKEYSQKSKELSNQYIESLMETWRERRIGRSQYEEKLRFLLYELLMKVSRKVSIFEKQVDTAGRLGNFIIAQLTFSG